MRSMTGATASRASRAREDYQLGLAFFHKRRWRAAARHFGLADRASQRDDEDANVYTSYHGLALICCGDISGLNLCRHAAGVETQRADVFVNLVLAELRYRHRRRAYEALCGGLAIAPRSRRLRLLALRMGVRRQPPLPFLRRENRLNKWLGKVTYRQPAPPAR